jgi:uncharacterized membrane protein YhaH (DUF805 family)
MWDWVVHCFKNYAVFSGRAARPEYWWFQLFNLVVAFVIVGLTLDAPGLRSPFKFLYWALTVVPSFAVASRRLHDTGHSFWWVFAPMLVVVVPIAVVGLTKPTGLKGNPSLAATLMVLLLASFGYAIWLLILFCHQGDVGPNRYGDPAPTTPG